MKKKKKKKNRRKKNRKKGKRKKFINFLVLQNGKINKTKQIMKIPIRKTNILSKEILWLLILNLLSATVPMLVVPFRHNSNNFTCQTISSINDGVYSTFQDTKICITCKLLHNNWYFFNTFIQYPIFDLFLNFIESLNCLLLCVSIQHFKKISVYKYLKPLTSRFKKNFTLFATSNSDQN